MNALERLQTALVERYRIDGEAGAGGMATVYKAYDLRHHRRVALKVLRPDLGAVLGAERFLNEIRVTANLQHPNILPLFDSGEVEGLLYYVMPLVEGESLRARLERERQLPVDEAVHLAVAVSSALDYAHQHGVIHRDLKPENILLQSGEPVVADFGIALAVSNASGNRLTQTGLSLGTPAYMSPEQATGDSHLDGRSDIYSLAAVAYEMLAGGPPHNAATAQGTIAKILTERPASVRASRSSVPPHVDATLSRALEKLPADRFTTAREFGEALSGRTSTLATYAAASYATTTGAPPSSWRALVTSPFWVVACLATAAVAAWALSSRPERPGVTRFSVVLPVGQGLASEAFGGRVALSPDGRTIAYLGPGTTALAPRVWLRSLDDLIPRSIEGAEAGVGSLTFSPDGERLAFVAMAPRAVLRVANVAGGGAQTIADSGVGLGGLSWGSDGYIYYDALGLNSIRRVPETGGRIEVISRADTARRELDHILNQVLPNGHGILITIRRVGGVGEREVGAVDLRTREVHHLGRGVGAWYATSGHLLVLNQAGTLLAAPFDLERLAVTGGFVAVVSGLSTSQSGQADVAISESGVLVYTAGRNLAGNRELVWVTREGTVTQVDSQWSGFFGGRVRLSPDGRLVAATRESFGTPGNVWVKQLDQGPATRLPEVSALDPGWSPDGRTLALGATDGIWIGPADGSVPPRHVLTTRGAVRRPEFTPDGEWLLFDGGFGIRAHHLRGDSQTVTLIQTPGAGTTAPAVHPQGKWLAYNSIEAGPFEVYIRPFPDVNASKRKISVNGGLSPRWSRDGRELYFIDGLQDMIAVPIRAAATLEVGEPRRLFSARDLTYPGGPAFDVSSDGRFLMTRLLASRTPTHEELIIVQNFNDELRSRVKSQRRTP
jgi:serine/threonine-protein kinase